MFIITRGLGSTNPELLVTRGYLPLLSPVVALTLREAIIAFLNQL